MRVRSVARAVILAALASWLVTGHTAPPDADSYQAQIMAGSCFNCHGTDGTYGEDSIPDIAGMPEDILLAQLKAFRADEIPNTTIMNRLVKAYSDDELAVLARYFSSKGAQARQ